MGRFELHRITECRRYWNLPQACFVVESVAPFAFVDDVAAAVVAGGEFVVVVVAAVAVVVAAAVAVVAAVVDDIAVDLDIVVH